MHGLTSTDDAIDTSLSRHRERPAWLRGSYRWAARHNRWLLFVLLPTLIVAGYMYLIAADQYETEAHIVVRSAEASQSAPSGLNQALAVVGGGSASEKDALIVADYLSSHDAVAALQPRLDLVQMFRRPEADFFSKLWDPTPTPETLLRFYNGKVFVKVSTDTGITTLRVRAFRPADAMAIIQELLKLGEARVNTLNRRNFASAVALSRQQVAEAEQNVEAVQGRITDFRRGSRDFNPQTTGQARTSLVSQLQGRLAEARAQESSMAAALASTSPQLVAMRERVAGLAREAAAERSQLAAGPGNVATGLGTYEGLQLRQQLAGKQYEGATAALQRASEEAIKQQLFIVPVVDPNLPVKSLYPKRLRLVVTVFLALLMAYGIGWLIVAGVKEHAA